MISLSTDVARKCNVEVTLRDIFPYYLTLDIN